jgi:hypothetical protein
MFHIRTLRLPASAAAAVVVAMAMSASPAIAAKPLPKPTGLEASVDAHPGDTYDVSAKWDVSANATSYRVALTKGGATLASKIVTTNTWNPTVTAAPGTATLSVRAVAGRKPGRTATLTVPLADVTDPTGIFSADSDNTSGVATITQDSLSDDSGAGQVTRTVDWGDGSSTQAWTTGTTIIHPYTLTPAQEIRFAATVTLTDAANNTTTVDVIPAPVFNDHTAPTGSFSVSPTAAWSSLTKVAVTQDTLNDDRTPNAFITRLVTWGDGTTSDWTGTGPAKHVYAKAGTHTPKVTLTDEAGNASARIATQAVVVSTDTVAPSVTIVRAKPAHSMRAWRTLRGKATDAQTGIKSVWLKAVEKRGGAWFGYNATTHTWVEAASKAKAFKKAKPFHRTTDASDRWTATLSKLKKGTLVLKVRATDRVNNRSATLTRKATLTKP